MAQGPGRLQNIKSGSQAQAGLTAPAAMLWVGLTGGIASGKSTVAKVLRQHQLAVLDADEIVHELLRSGGAAVAPVLAHFGTDLVNSDGGVDRKRLGEIVFSSPEKLAELEKIVHPMVRAKVQSWRDRQAQNGIPFAIYDVPLLFESGRVQDYDATVLVWCREEQQKDRLALRSGLTGVAVAQRLQAQMSLEKKRKLATYVLDNSGPPEKLVLEVERLVAWLQGQIQKR